MNRRLAFSAFVAAATATTALAAGATSAGAAGPPPPAPDPPNRVVIVLFDQMIPAYANQFDMPNFRKLRDSGTDFKKAYLGYMASETVIAHNVITSGLEPRHMGRRTRPTATTATSSARALTRCTSPVISACPTSR